MKARPEPQAPSTCPGGTGASYRTSLAFVEDDRTRPELITLARCSCWRRKEL